MQECNPAVKQDLPILHQLLLLLLLLGHPQFPPLPLLLLTYNTHTTELIFFSKSQFVLLKPKT
jgi:hypothetical protein